MWRIQGAITVVTVWTYKVDDYEGVRHDHWSS